MTGLQWISRELIGRVLDEARKSPRRRMNYNFHAAMEENPHRFLNVMLEGTYITPHRHLFPPKHESFLVIEGRVAFFVFDDEGRVQRTGTLGEGGVLGVDLEPGIWHTMAVLSPHAVCYEVKPGPYAPANDKEFAPWAPREGESGAQAYLNSLLAASGFQTESSRVKNDR